MKSETEYTLDKIIGPKAFFNIPEEERDKTVWLTRDYKPIYIKNLSDNHLENIISMFKQNPEWRAEQQPFIYGEIKRREMLKWANTTKAGAILYGKTDEN